MLIFALSFVKQKRGPHEIFDFVGLKKKAQDKFLGFLIDN